ncbi:hypothetical protein BUALT_Bualt17G0000900 [Buddleja alternifolia]|uniref:Uncharacterized protein n=1 Tax=Buddleja alternifolia TaxID=168488 RepID=A0AAV6WCR7_9LAMI|nr:hypothetical protein BUALT_Bualt17G0000900 [Buddleja alternifolia]
MQAERRFDIYCNILWIFSNCCVFSAESWLKGKKKKKKVEAMVRSLEQTADELRDRCQKLYKGWGQYLANDASDYAFLSSEVLGEACDGDMGFATSLEAFSGGIDDLLGVSIGGPVVSKFISALHELATYKELLRSQVILGPDSSANEYNGKATFSVCSSPATNSVFASPPELNSSIMSWSGGSLSSTSSTCSCLFGHSCKGLKGCLQRKHSPLAFKSENSCCVSLQKGVLAVETPEPVVRAGWLLSGVLVLHPTCADPVPEGAGSAGLEQLNGRVNPVVEHVLVDRLSQFLSVDLQDAKYYPDVPFVSTAEEEMNIASLVAVSTRPYMHMTRFLCQAREKFASLKKTTRDEVVAELEEVSALMNIEAKKKFEFLESFSAIMDAHLRYFKLGYDLLNQMEPFIHQKGLALKCFSIELTCKVSVTRQIKGSDLTFSLATQVLTYAQQSKEQANIEQDKLAKRIQEYRTQSELTQLEASNKLETSSNAFGMNRFGMSAYKSMEAIMLVTAKAEVQTIKQGYLLKRSSSLRADWKRRFFILDSQGTLYYYRNKGAKPGGSPSFHSVHQLEHNNRVFGRFRTRHHQASTFGEESLGCSTVDLRTSTLKIDAEDTDLRLCFRIISPLKTYTLQAENETDRVDWMNKITGVITSLLNSHLQQLDLGKNDNYKSCDLSGESFSRPLDNNGSASDDMRVNRGDSVCMILREVPGNNECAECCSSEPDWASLNLGILMCIECSGIHRNLGVHVSKVRSITLDVKVWEPTVLDLFKALGNVYCNSVWEELLPLQKDTKPDSGDLPLVIKPSPRDAIDQKEKYIQAKYARKLFVNKEGIAPGNVSASTLWEAVRANNLQEVYRIAIASDVNIVNSTYDDDVGCKLYNDEKQRFHESGKKMMLDPATCERVKSSGDPGSCLEGCSLLHLACQNGSLVMLELLLQLGADINKCDFHGRTPLQHCILKGNNEMAKFLLRRGARASLKDGGGLTALERAMEMGAITDEALFILLAESC